METAMKSSETPPGIDDPQAFADLEEVCRLISDGKKVTDPELIRRIEEGAQRGPRGGAKVLRHPKRRGRYRPGDA
jgi:hypothetical protein